MSANFTRRHDLFDDAGFPNGPELLQGLAGELERLGLSGGDPSAWDSPQSAPRRALADRVGRVPQDQLRLACLVPEWLSERAGDLTTALWLVRQEHGAALDFAGFLLAVFDALLRASEVAQGGKREALRRDAVAFARFVLDLGFDWSRVYDDRSLAYQFMREREPNPLVWRMLDELERRAQPVRVLELGCGRGNDAFGLLDSPLVRGYVGIDLVEEALDAFRKRAAATPPPLAPLLHRGDFAAVLDRLPPGAENCNLIYSYSSLHYFSSSELRRIFALARRHLLDVAPGFLVFGIKGAGSIWHGQGLPLYRPDVWVNWDGQSRWFPGKAALQRELDLAGFEIHFHELHDHWGYSEAGRRDVFHYVFCSPRR